MHTINLYQAKIHLSRLIDRAAAGEEVVIARHGGPWRSWLRISPPRLPAARVRSPAGYGSPKTSTHPCPGRSRRTSRIERAPAARHPRLIWALAEPERLPNPSRGEIESPDNQILVSAASTWEIAIKSALGKIDFPLNEPSEVLAQIRFDELPVTIRQTVHLAHPPPVHRDPFDRLRITRAMAEDLPVATHDAVFGHCPVKVVWS